MKRILLGLVVGCTFSSVGYAQSADQLFQEGMKLADAGNYEAACPKFAASQQIDPAFGTLFNLADCHEKTGQSKAALEEFRQAVAMAHGAGQKDRELKAMRRAEALEPKVKPEPNPVTIESKPAEKASPELTVVPSKAFSPVAPSEPSLFPPQRVAALGVAGIGLASVVLGTVSGLNASSKWKSAQDGHCNAKDQCDPFGRGLVDDAKGAATVSNVGFIAGGSLIAASAVLWFTTKSPVPVAPIVGTTNGLLVQGTF